MLLHCLFVFCLAAVTKADCYSHDGIKALDSRYYSGAELVSCGNGTDNCCLANEKCGTNLLCANANGGIARQYCDNAAWIGCSDMCAGNDAAGVSIHDCGNNIYCCGVNTDKTCCTDERAFYVDPDNGGVTQTTVAAKTKAPRWFTVDSSSILASGSATSTSSSTSASKTSTSSSAFSSASPVPTTANSTSSASPTSTASSAASSKISAGAGAGIGVGVAAVVIFICILVWLLLRRRARNASRNAASEVDGTTAFVPTGDKMYYTHNSELDNGYPATQELDGGRPPPQELDVITGQTPKIPPGYWRVDGRN